MLGVWSTAPARSGGDLMEAVTGIHQVDGWGMSNGYVVETDDGLLAVDVWSAGHTLDTIRALGRPAQDLMLIVITHWHPDHIRGAAELRRRTGARVAVHELDAAVLAGGEFPAKGRRMQQVIHRVFRIRPVAADLLLHDGDDVVGWQVVHMPGHTAGSIVRVSCSPVTLCAAIDTAESCSLTLDCHWTPRPPFGRSSGSGCCTRICSYPGTAPPPACRTFPPRMPDQHARTRSWPLVQPIAFRPE